MVGFFWRIEMPATNFPFGISAPLYNSSGTQVATITDNTGGTVSTTLAAIAAGATYAQSDIVAIKDALASIAAILNEINGG